MFDEMDRARQEKRLLWLLAHYTAANAADPEAWQDRLMQLKATRDEDLIKLHGELLAYDWIEQNTGVTSLLQAGAVPRCYRLTSAGRRALKQLRTSLKTEEENVEEVAGSSSPEILVSQT